MNDLIVELEKIYDGWWNATNKAEKVLHDRKKAKQLAADADAVHLFELIPEIIKGLKQGE